MTQNMFFVGAGLVPDLMRQMPNALANTGDDKPLEVCFHG
jgi:hypothetical protein